MHSEPKQAAAPPAPALTRRAIHYPPPPRTGLLSWLGRAAGLLVVACPLVLIPAGAAVDGSEPTNGVIPLATNVCGSEASDCDPTVRQEPTPQVSPDPPEPTPEATPTCQVTGHQTVVFLDPGHGANVTPQPATSGGSEGIVSGESANGVEDVEVFAVAMKVQAALEEAGYLVVLSRQANPDPTGTALWQRGNAAEAANDGQPADLAISIHTDLASSVGAGQIYYNKLGGYRQNNSGGTRQTFTNAQTAATAERYAVVFQAVRSADQEGTVTITAGHEFPASRNLGSHGDIPIVMLSAPSVPWIYNEFGRTYQGGLTEEQIELYASSLVRATQLAIGPTEGTGQAITTCQ